MRRRTSAVPAAVLLLLLFLCTGAAAVIVGVRVWHGAETRMQTQLAQQTPLSYIAGKARQSDRITAGAFADGTPVLLLESEQAGERYLTRLYCYQGNLCELYTPADVSLQPSDGIALLPVQSLAVTERDGLLCVQCTVEDKTAELLLSVKGEEAQP